MHTSQVPMLTAGPSKLEHMGIKLHTLSTRNVRNSLDPLKSSTHNNCSMCVDGPSYIRDAVGAGSIERMARADRVWGMLLRLPGTSVR